MLKKQMDMIRLIERHGKFRAPAKFDEVRKMSQAIISPGVKMGEGWLLPAEMVELISEGVNNIVCTQPLAVCRTILLARG